MKQVRLNKGSKHGLLNILILPALLFLSLRYAGSSVDFFRPFLGYLFFTGLTFLVYFDQLGKVKKTDTFLYLFMLYMVVSLMWSGSVKYGWDKAYMLFLFTFFFVITQKYIVTNFTRVAYYFLISNLVFLALFYITFGNPLEILKNVAWRLKDEETNPITFSRYLGFASFFVIYLMGLQRKLLFKALLISVLAVSLIYMFLSGSKGPLFAFIIALSILFLLLNRGVFPKLIFFVGFGLTIFLVVNQLKSSQMSDFVAMRYTANEYSYTTRSDFIENSITEIASSNILVSIFGSGSGNYAIFEKGVDERSYPHNIIIEILFEYGMLGLILFFAFVFCSLKGWKKCIDDKIYCFLLALWIYAGLNSMVSGDVYGNFLFFGMCTLLYARRKYLKYNQLRLAV